MINLDKHRETQFQGDQNKIVNYSYKSIAAFNQGYFSSHAKDNGNTGRWKTDEHIQFLEGIKKHGKNWKLVEQHVPSRSGPQIRSHAQKFFKRIQIKGDSRETPIELLNRTNFSLEVILSGIDEKDKTLEMASEFRAKMEHNTIKLGKFVSLTKFIDIVNGNGDDFSVKRAQNRTKAKQSESEESPKDEENQDKKEEQVNQIQEESEEEIPQIRIIKHKEVVPYKANESFQREKKFSYFPSSYKMSTIENQEINQAEKEKSAHNEQPEAGIYLQQADSMPNNKRKYSEMIRLDKLDKSENSPFHIPSNPNEYENSAKKRINKLMNK